MDVKEFRDDFVEAVNGVLEKHFEGMEGKPNKEELNSLLETVFKVMISILSASGKLKGGGK